MNAIGAVSRRLTRSERREINAAACELGALYGRDLALRLVSKAERSGDPDPLASIRPILRQRMAELLGRVMRASLARCGSRMPQPKAGGHRG
jgi:hypothetical protein